MHNSVEALSRGAPEEGLEGFRKGVKVCIFIEQLPILNSGKQVHCDDSKYEVDEHEDDAHIDK